MNWLQGLAFQELKRTVYFWGLLLGIGGLAVVWFLRPDDLYVRFIYPTLAGLFALWCIQLRLGIQTERIEQQVAIGLTVVFGGKFVFYLFNPDLSSTWLEVEDTYWNLAFQMIIFYMVFDARRGLMLTLALTGLTLLAGGIRYSAEPQHETLVNYIRAEFRMLCMGLLLFVMARIKDRLILVSSQMEHTEALARTDTLTGVFNRLAINEALENEVRYPKGLFVVLLDIDHFKQINDQHGHAAGDGVLQQIAQLLQSKLRKGDWVGRWGGEEFLLIMRAEHPRELLGALERLRQHIHQHPFATGPVSASFGVGIAVEGDTPHALVRRADIALYRAKHLGRNRIELESENPVGPSSTPVSDSEEQHRAS